MECSSYPYLCRNVPDALGDSAIYGEAGLRGPFQFLPRGKKADKGRAGYKIILYMTQCLVSVRAKVEVSKP